MPIRASMSRLALPPAVIDALHPMLIAAIAIATVALSAHWLTHWLAPGPVAALPDSPRIVGQEDPRAAHRLFGARGQAVLAPGGLTLTGVYARPRGGFAVFRGSDGALFALEGEELKPGILLKRIAADHVLLWADGVESRLDLPMVEAAALLAGAPAPLAAPATDTP